MGETELKPCPFCGERAETDFIPEHHSYQIECSDSMGCTARVTRDSELGAIEAWNCRAPAPASQPVAAPAGMEPVARVEIYPLDTDHNYAWRAIPLTDATCMRDGDFLCQMSAQHTGTVDLAAPSGPAREPLSQERLQFLSGEYEDIPEEGVAFRDGWRSAEMHHGIK